MKNMAQFTTAIAAIPFEDRTAAGIAKVIIDLPEVYTFNDTILPVVSGGANGGMGWTALAGNIGNTHDVDNLLLATIRVEQLDESVETMLAFCTIGGSDEHAASLRNALALPAPNGGTIGSILADALGYQDWTVLIRRDSNTSTVVDSDGATISPMYVGSTAPTGYGALISGTQPIAWCPLAVAIEGDQYVHMCVPKQLAWYTLNAFDGIFGVTGPLMYTGAISGVRRFVGPFNVFRTDDQNMVDLKAIAQDSVDEAFAAHVGDVEGDVSKNATDITGLIAANGALFALVNKMSVFGTKFEDVVDAYEGVVHAGQYIPRP